MASLAIDQNILNNQAKSSLDQAKQYLTQARLQCNSLSIPTSFLYRTYLKNLANTLLNIEIDIDSSKTKIDDTIAQYNNIDFKVASKTSSLVQQVNDVSLNIDGSNIKNENAAEKVLSDFEKTGAEICEKVKNFVSDVWNWFTDKAEEVQKKVEEILKKTASLIAVATQGILSGLGQVAEAVVDLGVLAKTGVASVFTGVYDAGQAIYGAITGNEWNSVTKAMWNDTKSFVATTWVKNGFDALNNTAYGKWLNENSFGDWAKTDGFVSQITEGIGYAVGTTALCVATFGTATPLVLATTAGSLAVSKYTEEAWNNNKISIDTGSGNYDMSLNYDELSTLNNERKLKKQIEQIDEFGNVITTEVTFVKNKDNSYSAIINGQELNCNVDETGILEGLGYGGINGLWEGAQWYVGGKIGSGQFKSLTGGIKSAAMQKIAVSGTRVVLDSVTGAVETPFRTLLDTMYNDMTWEEAWNKNGGWNGVLSQTLIAGIMSAGGEVLPMDKIMDKLGVNNLLEKLSKKGLNLNQKRTNKLINKYLNNIADFNGKGISFEDYLKKNHIDVPKLNTKAEVSEYLGDGKLYLLDKLEGLSNVAKGIKNIQDYYKTINIADIDVQEMFNNVSPYLTSDQVSKVIDLANSGSSNASKLYMLSRLNDLSSASLSVSQMYNYYSNQGVADIDIQEMFNNISPYLTSDQISKATNLINNGKSSIKSYNYSYEELASLYNYTACGGFEINGWLNDATYQTTSGDTIRYRDQYTSLDQIQNIASGHGRNKILESSQSKITDNLDSIIANTNYDDAIVTYRGVKELFDNNTKLDVTKLKVGDSFSSNGYQSSSILLENCYGVTHDTHNIILEIVVPPNSGTAAYIENVTGCTNYCQMEVLIKRNAKMTVVGDVHMEMINGQYKTIVPVVVQ